LSQRLSHACPSINAFIVKLHKAHYTSYRLFDGLFTRIPLVILELILAQGGS